MCDHANDPGGREAAMPIIAPGVHCDPCLVPLVKALHESDLPSVSTVHGPEPIRTVASCCGHGRRPATISLADDRHLLVLTWDELARVDRLWPGINDEPATARMFTDDELAEHDARVRRDAAENCPKCGGDQVE